MHDYRVLATDVSEKIIRVGARGIYSTSARDDIREYDPLYAHRYLSCHRERTVRVTEGLRENVYFRQFNLKFHTNPFEGQFHLILLRNVLIYFDNEMIQSVIEECERLLRPGGLLLIGQTENLGDVNHDLEKLEPSVFQLPQ